MQKTTGSSLQDAPLEVPNDQLPRLSFSHNKNTIKAKTGKHGYFHCVKILQEPVHMFLHHFPLENDFARWDSCSFVE